jgi:hypothetical protein
MEVSMHDDGAFAFIQAVFHVVLFIVVHGRCAQRRHKRQDGRKLAIPARLNPQHSLVAQPPVQRTNQNTTERKFHETRSAIPKPVALPQEL